MQLDLEQVLKAINALKVQITELSTQQADKSARTIKSLKPKDESESYVTAKDSAAHLKISLSTLYLYIKQEKLPKVWSLGGRSKKFILS